MRKMHLGRGGRRAKGGPRRLLESLANKLGAHRTRGGLFRKEKNIFYACTQLRTKVLYIHLSYLGYFKKWRRITCLTLKLIQSLVASLPIETTPTLTKQG